MYNIKGPSKIVAKTARRGISQSIENYREHNKLKISDEENTCKLLPKPVFQKKMGPTSSKQENMTPEQIEVIKYIHESWMLVCSELDQENEDSTENVEGQQTIYIYKEEPCEHLQEFKPFDLEAWWGKRLYAHITASPEE